MQDTNKKIRVLLYYKYRNTYNTHFIQRVAEKNHFPTVFERERQLFYRPIVRVTNVAPCIKIRPVLFCK